MRRLKEAYGESKELDNFVELAQEDFRTYYKVEARRKNGTPKTQERYFYNEDQSDKNKGLILAELNNILKEHF